MIIIFKKTAVVLGSEDGQINGIRDSNWKTITKKHRFSNDTRALEKYHF